MLSKKFYDYETDSFFLSAYILLLTTASCSSDNSEEPVVVDNKYKFSFSIWVSDFNGNNLLSIYESDDSYSIEDISINPLHEKDNVTLETSEHWTAYSTSLVADDINSTMLVVNVDSEGSDGIIAHEFVIQWEKNNSKITDTIFYEIEKNNKNISCRSIFVNNKYKHLADEPFFPQTIYLAKLNPSTLNVLDKNKDDTRIEKEIDGLKFSFWLSDMDDKMTSIFDEKEVKERGFKFNIALTNNSDQNIYIDNDDIAPSLSNVFSADDNYIGRSCVVFLDIYTSYEIKPGETHYESSPWCSFDENT